MAKQELMAKSVSSTQGGSLPLDQQWCERTNPQTGLMEQLPALHSAWCSDVQFLPYMPPRWDDKGHVDPLWIEAMEVIDSDLHWLLQQPHQIFWCQVMYDKSLHKLLDSYLRSAPRSHDDHPALPLGVKDTQRNVHRRVFMVFLRMATYKETADNTLSPEAFATILYEHYLFDIPKLLDLCVLYGSANRRLLTKMITNVFEKQPKYKDDLKSSVDSILKLLDQVSAECHGRRGEEGGEHALRLSETKTLEPTELVDLLLYIADIGSTLRSFVDVYQPAAAILIEANLIERISGFYEATVPTLQMQWHSIKHSTCINNPGYVKTRFRQAKHDLAWVVHSLLTTYYCAGGGEGEGEGKDLSPKLPAEDSHVDGFLSAISTILSEKVFLREFEKHFSLSECILQVQQKFPSLDETHFDYVLSALGVHKTTDGYGTAAVGGAFPQATPSGPGEVESLVSQVKDLLPHLGEGFIEACLREYGNSPEAVLSHVLDGSLSPTLLQMDQTMPRKRPPTASGQEGETKQVKGVLEAGTETGASLLDQRASVFDNDEFDVLRRGDVDFSRVHIGKRFDGSLTSSSLLDDKSHLDATRDLYKTYEYGGSYGYQWEGGGQEEELPFLFEYDQYNDEYDDTYDSHNVGAADEMSADVLFTVKRLNEKGRYRRQIDSSDEEKEEDETKVPVHNPFQPSFSGPVTLLKRTDSPVARENRAKPEAKTHQPKSGREDHSTSARGKPGSETKTRGETRTRQLNERHKGNRANHNRKNLADKKRNKGFGLPQRS